MQEHIFFQKAIEYTKSMIKEDKEEHIYNNLSTLLFVYSDEMFSLNKLLDLDKIIAVYTESGICYEILVQPDVRELAETFGYDLNDKKVYSTTELVQELGEYKEICIKLLYAIEQFYQTRVKVLLGESIHEISPYEEEYDEEIMKLISSIQEVLPGISRQVVDYECGSTYKQSQILEDLYAFSNYELFRDFCYEHSKNCDSFKGSEIPCLVKNIKERDFLQHKINSGEVDGSKYWDIQQRINELEADISSDKKLLEQINKSSFYKREFFAMFYIALEEVVEKEQALNNFIFKVLDDELQTVKK